MKVRKSIADYIERQADMRRTRADRDHEAHADRFRVEATILSAVASDIRAELDIAPIVQPEETTASEQSA